MLKGKSTQGVFDIIGELGLKNFPVIFWPFHLDQQIKYGIGTLGRGMLRLFSGWTYFNNLLVLISLSGSFDATEGSDNDEDDGEVDETEESVNVFDVGALRGLENLVRLCIENVAVETTVHSFNILWTCFKKLQVLELCQVCVARFLFVSEFEAIIWVKFRNMYSQSGQSR